MMASSVKVGVRPRIAIARSYSSSVIPSWRASARSTTGSFIGLPAPPRSQPVPPRLLPGMHDRIEQPLPVRLAEDLLGAAIRVRHHAEHVPLLVADAGDGMQRAVRIGVG